MWHALHVQQPKFRFLIATQRRLYSSQPIISINGATIEQNSPTARSLQSTHTTLFKNLTWTFPSRLSQGDEEYWAVISPSSVCRTAFLQTIAGQHTVTPPNARRYPLLSSTGTSPHRAIKYVGFDADRGNNIGSTGVRGAYLSARYESRRESTDYSLQNYLQGNTELNAIEHPVPDEDVARFKQLVKLLDLTQLLEMPVSSLSNGQTRRARIAKAIMDRPQLLLLDGPFMGLDPNYAKSLSVVLHRLARTRDPHIVISLRPEDAVPHWINQLVVINDHFNILAQDSKAVVLADKRQEVQAIVHSTSLEPATASTRLSRDGFPKRSPLPQKGERIVAMENVRIRYGNKTVLGMLPPKSKAPSRFHKALRFHLNRGERVGIFGPNGSGKTTLLSLITSDHPQTYKTRVKLFGRNRDKPGVSIFDLQRRMGHSSPEVHAFFPKHLTVRRTLESAWADAPLAKPQLDEDARRRVDVCLRWFGSELQAGSVSPPGTDPDNDLYWADDLRFGGLSFSSQRLALFLKAIVASPDIVILDEAFGGMDENVRDKAMLFLSQGETIERVINGVAKKAGRSAVITFRGLTSDQALLVVSHAKEDVPGCVRGWMCLSPPIAKQLPRFGRFDGPLELNPSEWERIWGSNAAKSSVETRERAVAASIYRKVPPVQPTDEAMCLKDAMQTPVEQLEDARRMRSSSDKLDSAGLVRTHFV